MRFADFNEDWEQRTLGEISEISTGKPFSSSDFSQNGNYKIITNKNVTGKTKDYKLQTDRINIYDNDIIKSYALSGNNILITMDGETGIARKYQDDKALLAQRVGRIQAKQIDFIFQIVSRSHFKNKMNNLSVGNTIKHISLDQIKNYNLYLPNATFEQEKIGVFLNRLDHQMIFQKKKLNLVIKMKKFALQKLFI